METQVVKRRQKKAPKKVRKNKSGCVKGKIILSYLILFKQITNR